MKTKTVKVAELRPADYNPRRISDHALEGLKNSLKRFGVVEPIIVNERTGNIVGGHQRLKALQDIGEQETTVICVDLPEGEEKALNVALNNPNTMGEFTDALEDIISEINDYDGDLVKDLHLNEMEIPADIAEQIDQGMDFGGEIEKKGDDINKIILYCSEETFISAKNDAYKLKEKYPGMVIRIEET